MPLSIVSECWLVWRVHIVILYTNFFQENAAQPQFWKVGWHARTWQRGPHILLLHLTYALRFFNFFWARGKVPCFCGFNTFVRPSLVVSWCIKSLHSTHVHGTSSNKWSPITSISDFTMRLFIRRFRLSIYAGMQGNENNLTEEPAFGVCCSKPVVMCEYLGNGMRVSPKWDMEKELAFRFLNFPRWNVMSVSPRVQNIAFQLEFQDSMTTYLDG